MKELIKGANAPLAASGLIQIHLKWQALAGDIDFACFALDADDRVPSDDWFVFYNQPVSPHGAVRLDPQRAAFLIDLDALPAAVRKCVFTATSNGGSLQADADATFIAAPTNGDCAIQFRLTEATAGGSLLLAELYRYHELWKVRAKGEGLKLDLAGLSRLFGVDVQDEAPKVDPPAPVRPTPAPVLASPPAPQPVPPPLPVRAAPPAPLILAPAPALVSSPASAPVLASPPAPVPSSAADPPTPPIDRHEKLKTYATLAIAFGSLTTAITTLLTMLITQCHR